MVNSITDLGSGLDLVIINNLSEMDSRTARKARRAIRQGVGFMEKVRQKWLQTAEPFAREELEKAEIMSYNQWVDSLSTDSTAYNHQIYLLDHGTVIGMASPRYTPEYDCIYFPGGGVSETGGPFTLSKSVYSVFGGELGVPGVHDADPMGILLRSAHMIYRRQ